MPAIFSTDPAILRSGVPKVPFGGALTSRLRYPVGVFLRRPETLPEIPRLREARAGGLMAAMPPQIITAMPRDPYIREKFTRDRTYARKLAVEYFEKFPKARYQTAVESWRHLQSQNIEFTMKRLREPIEG